MSNDPYSWSLIGGRMSKVKQANRADEARIAPRMALAVTRGGGLALLAGVLLLGRIVGSYELTDVLAAGDILRADPLYPVVLVLVLLGAFTKSAQFLPPPRFAN